MLWWDDCDVVRCGFWVNWSYNYIQGPTLTLPKEWALILVSFLALLVKLAGSYLWGIVCFAIHQVNASSRPQDDMYHHFQLLLRNSESESSFVRRLLTVSFAHKGARFEAYKRSLWLITIAGLHGTGIWVASTLSSRFITRSDEVQAIPRKCGWMRVTPADAALADEESFEAYNSLVVMARHGYRRSAAYSRTCYARMGTNSTICASYKQNVLPYNSNLSAPCPFNEKLCNGSTITLDTGHLLSDEHLGFNTRPEDAVSMRKVLTCVPLAGELHAVGWQEVPFGPTNSTDLARCYELGATDQTPVPGTTFCVWRNLLFWGDQPYRIMSASAFINYQGDQATHIKPIPELQSSDSDFTLIGLINRIIYPTPVVDPWFNAQNLTTGEGLPATGSFTATNAISFMGCQERYQFCTADGNNCSPFTGIYGIDPANSTGLNPTQLALFRVLWKVGWMAQLNFQLLFIGRENLIANDYLWNDGGVSASLPSDQWHREVTNWMNTSLAAMQRSAYTYARPTEFDIGPGIPTLKYIDEPDDEYMKLLCHKIKARSQLHQSFSVLSLFLTITLTLIIMAINFSLPTVMSYFQKRTGKGLRKRLEWIETSAFQLQRMAAEGRGIGPWNGREDDVPTLAEYGHLFNLTKLSLRGRWSRVGSYGVVSKGVRSDEGGEVEMDCLQSGASSLGVVERDRSGSQARLLDH